MRTASTLVVCFAVALTTVDVVTAQEARSRREISPQDAELLRAARSGDVAALEASLAEGADPNARGAGGRTPLLEATAAGQAARDARAPPPRRRA